MTIRFVFRCLAWLLVAAIGFATLAPIGLRPVTSAPADIERFAAFAALGGAFCLGYPKHRVAVLLAVVGIVGILEAGQELAPSRHGRFQDAMFKAAGAVVGLAVAAALDRRRQAG